MTQVPGIPDIPGGGTRQQRAAQLKAEMEAEQQQQRSDAQAPGVSRDEPDGESQVAEQAEQQGTGPIGQGDYVVKEGDCVSSIAKNSGHFWETIWNEPANVELQEIRQDPNVLLPDDRVTVPAIRKKQEPGDTEMRHRFVRRGEPAKIHIRVLEEEKPRGNQPYQLDVDGTAFTGTTAADGSVALPIPGNARKGKLVVGPPDDQVEYDLILGALPPLSEIVGVQDRLDNLGFNCGETDGKLGPRTKRALAKFQEENGLPITGEPDEATRAKLEECHGA